MYFRTSGSEINKVFFFHTGFQTHKFFTLEDFHFDDPGTIKDLFLYFLIAATAVIFLVVFFTLFYSWKYKRKKGDLEECEQLHRHRKLEFSLIGVAFISIAVSFYFTRDAMNKEQDIPENAKPDLFITGHQWWWEVEYGDGGLVTANEIHVPIGKELLVQFNSDDVIHGWWVPELGRKIEMIPGVDNFMKLKVKDEGEYWGACSELCGAEHAWMRIRVVARTAEDFQEWKEEQLAPVKGATDPLFQKGQQLFATKTCTDCHSISPTAENPNMGPNLANFGSRKYFLTNVKLNNKENLSRWLRYPGVMKSTVEMPHLLLEDDEINALIFYLNNLK